MSSSRVGGDAGEADRGGRTVSMEDIEDIVMEGKKTSGSHIPIIHAINYPEAEKVSRYNMSTKGPLKLSSTSEPISTLHPLRRLHHHWALIKVRAVVAGHVITQSRRLLRAALQNRLRVFTAVHCAPGTPFIERKDGESGCLTHVLEVLVKGILVVP